MDKFLEPEVLVFCVPIVTIVALFCYKIAKVNSDNDLKRRLVERGFSVDEIERIINAGVKKDDD